MNRRFISRTIIFMIVIFSLVTCKKDEIGTLPTVSTYAPKFYSSTAVTLGCIVGSDGDSDFICGIYIGITPNPEAEGSQFQIGSDAGTFIGQITGLTPETQYYIRAYVKNADIEELAGVLSITTPGKITDFDNNFYETVFIEDQLWMAENLMTTHYLNGDLIDSTDPSTLDISIEDSPKYQWPYDGDNANTLDYGRLYTYYTISDSRKVCPTGWHIPSDAEWTLLESTLGGFNIAGNKLKESGNSHWIAPYNLYATNETLYTALPGGYRNATGVFSHLENYGYWWSSTGGDENKAWGRSLYVQSDEITRVDFTKSNGLSVRCIKD